MGNYKCMIIMKNNRIFEIISFDKDFDNKDQIIRIFCH